jgi:putative oxygen-independent coproporphyrinogen III oxidase
MEAPLALYIHWPFCVSKCPYCDFNSHVRDAVDQDAWAAALLADMAHEAALLPGRRIGSIFFGGGTPSLMPASTVAALIRAADAHWGLTEHCEITLEANPNSVEVAAFAELAAAGVNRVSIGVQSFDAQALNFLGRAHDAAEARRAITAAQAHFARVSFDLIYARPGQTLPAWEAELREGLSFGTDHLSLYQLTIEPGTRFESDVRRGDFVPLDADAAADLFEATQAITAAAGLPAYEISNHAKPGRESHHNLAYWRYQDYAGIGPGAHGRRGNLATLRHKKPENWIAAVGRNGHGLQSETALTPEDRAAEALLMGLRLAEGVNLAHIAAQSGVAQPDLLDAAATAQLADQGLIIIAGDHIRVAPHAMILLDAILPRIVAVG